MVGLVLGLLIGLQVVSQIALFLIEAIFSLYIGAVVIRLLLGFARANFNNPLSQFLVKVTNPVLVPMRRFIPSIGKNRHVSCDFSFCFNSY